MRPLKEKVSITIDSDIVKAIEEMAEKDDRSFSQYVNMILKEHVTNKTDKKIIIRARTVVGHVLFHWHYLLNRTHNANIRKLPNRY